MSERRACAVLRQHRPMAGCRLWRVGAAGRSCAAAIAIASRCGATLAPRAQPGRGLRRTIGAHHARLESLRPGRDGRPAAGRCGRRPPRRRRSGSQPCRPGQRRPRDLSSSSPYYCRSQSIRKLSPCGLMKPALAPGKWAGQSSALLSTQSSSSLRRDRADISWSQQNWLDQSG